MINRFSFTCTILECLDIGVLTFFAVFKKILMDAVSLTRSHYLTIIFFLCSIPQSRKLQIMGIRFSLYSVSAY